MWSVAKRELTVYFKNPIGYIVIAVYAMLSAIIFTITVLNQNTSYLGQYFGMWLFVADIVVISILSMRYFSEDRKNKTDQLLLTSPTGIYEIVIGKFLGSLIIFMIAFCINIFYILVVQVYGTLDFGIVITNLVGTLFVCSAMVSIGLFISSITESQLTSAAGTFILLFGLMVIKLFASFLPNVVQSIVGFFTIYDYYSDFANGIFSFPAIIYYISITAVFLFLTVRMIEKRRWN